ncbi:MAG: hypothetical protein JEZ14_08785, partial [Marinilabiliaceae bacterium]|nr:hypothetical protein [Marinilabiliaceae bacterium]
MKNIIAFCALVLTSFSTSFGQINTEVLDQLKSDDYNMRHRLDKLEKMVDDLLWYEKVGDIAHVDKVYMYGPPKWKEKNPTGLGAGNPVKFWSYLFFPKNIDSS